MSDSDSSDSASSAAPQSEGPLIMVVDDTAKNLQVVGSILRNEGYKLLPVTSGEQALTRLSAVKPNLILLDIMMPGMDGFEVCRRIKADESTREIPVIFLSAAGDSDYIVKGLEIGAVDYVPKPFNSAELLARVHTHLSLKQALADVEEAKSQLEAELEQAADYVKSILPTPVAEPVGIDWRFHPSSKLGGDGLGYRWIDDRHLAAFVVDVCDHGVGAALLAVSVINMLRGDTLHSADLRSPADVASALNAAFPMEEHNDLFFSLWYGVIDTEARQLVYTSPGHPCALLVPEHCDDPDAIIELSAKGPPLGAFDEPPILASSIALEEGRSELFLLTDGTYEVQGVDGTLLGLEGLKRLILDNQTDLAAIFDEVTAYGEADHIDDDFTLVQLRLPAS